MDRLDISRNDIAARQELTQQALALSLIRPLAELLNSRVKGKAEQLSGCDVIAAAMWLFDHMLYYESRSDLPGITRKEAEVLLVDHFHESNPGWDDGACIAIAQNIFRLLTPKDGFNHTYYDFSERSYKEYFFRLIEWELREGTGAVYKLTAQGMILYSTRLEDGGLESATVSAIRADRTLRRGEINLAIELAETTIRNLKRFRGRISANLRAARTGDTSFTFNEIMKPLLDDSYDLLEIILRQTADTLHRIGEDAREAPSDKRKALLKAEDSFNNTNIESQEFQNYIRTVQSEFLTYRRELIGMQDLAVASRDLTTSILKPMLGHSTMQISKYAENFLRLLLPPNLESKSARKTHYCIDPLSILSTYHRWLEHQYEANVPSIDSEAEDYSDPPPLLDSATIAKAHRWMSDYVEKHGGISFQDVISIAEQQSMDRDLILACLLLIGAEATSDKQAIEVVLDGVLQHNTWNGDNLGIRTVN